MVTLPPLEDSLPLTSSSTDLVSLVEKPLPNLMLPVARPSAMALLLSAAFSGLSVLLSLTVAIDAAQARAGTPTSAPLSLGGRGGPAAVGRHALLDDRFVGLADPHQGVDPGGRLRQGRALRKTPLEPLLRQLIQRENGALHPCLGPDMRVRTAHSGQVELRRKSPYLRLDPGERHILAVYLEGVKAPQVPAAHLDGDLALPGWVGGDDHQAGRPGRKDRSNRPSC